MTAYVDFTFYEEEYLGSQITEADFPSRALSASAIIDLITYDRAAEVIEDNDDADLVNKVKLAVCTVAETYQRYYVNEEKEISSESVGGHSVSYITTKEMERTRDKRYVDAAKIYLGNTGLMYMGIENTDGTK
jgi:hypothetical protein